MRIKDRSACVYQRVYVWGDGVEAHVQSDAMMRLRAALLQAPATRAPDLIRMD